MLGVHDPPDADGHVRRRSLAFANDSGRVVFEAFGEPLAFENLELYERPRKRDRFNFETLEAYLRELGISAFDETFYAHDQVACLVEKHGPQAPQLEEFPLPGVG
jgi:hypothetical protein